MAKEVSHLLTIDLKFMRYGVKRWIARYVKQRYRCRSCLKTFYPTVSDEI